MTDRKENPTHSRICNPPIRLHQRRRAEVLVLIPPITGATRRTACTQDTLVHPIELFPIFRGLEELALGGDVVVLEVRLD